jgi:hypothetical protein
MNELFAADPTVCVNSNDLRLLLGSFGPYTGRYLAMYPINWTHHIEAAAVGEVESARIKTILRRARDGLKVVTRRNLTWDESEPWLSNAVRHWPATFNALIGRQSDLPTVIDLSDLDLPATAEERIFAKATEYARVSKILAVLSPELALVDPYLNPLKGNYQKVLFELFSQIAKGRCQKISLWARADVVYGRETQTSVNSELIESLRKLAANSKLKSGTQIEVILVEDETSNSKMHGRYLLSIKGGIRFDQGFQQLPPGRKVEVGPIGQVVHTEMLKIYFDGIHDMNISARLLVAAQQ